jgi:hypothetical protein
MCNVIFGGKAGIEAHRRIQKLGRKPPFIESSFTSDRCYDDRMSSAVVILARRTTSQFM